MDPRTTLTSRTLEAKTLDYWNISAAQRGKPSRTPKATVQNAITMCNDNLAVLNPARPLAFRLAVMLDGVIMGSSRKRKADQHVATVLKLAK